MYVNIFTQTNYKTFNPTNLGVNVLTVLTISTMQKLMSKSLICFPCCS